MSYVQLACKCTSSVTRALGMIAPTSPVTKDTCIRVYDMQVRKDDSVYHVILILGVNAPHPPTHSYACTCIKMFMCARACTYMFCVCTCMYVCSLQPGLYTCVNHHNKFTTG